MNKGFFENLTAEQQEAALNYTGPECVGSRLMQSSRKRFECDCTEPFHEMVIDYEAGDGEVFIYLRMKHFLGFWQRMVNAFKYVMKIDERRIDYCEIVIYDLDKIEELRDHLINIVEARKTKEILKPLL